MRCPFCGHDVSQVKDSRPTDDGSAIRRRRQCETCNARFTTFERIQLRDIVVLKSEGRRQAFDRDKLYRSVALACSKRPIDANGIDRVVANIQRILETGGDTEVEASQIGALAMNALKSLDSVAYIRFASVYNDFREARDFEDFAANVREVAGSEGAADNWDGKPADL